MWAIASPYNNFNGVAVLFAGATRNAILSNSIFANGRIGILTLFGGNNNFDPDVLSATASSNDNSTTVQGAFVAAPNTANTLQLFANVQCDPSGFGEGQTLLGSFTANTDSSGNATFNQTFAGNVPTGQFITATATELAFASSRDPQADTEVYVMNADGSSQTNITNAPLSSDARPDWQRQSALPTFSISGVVTNNADGANPPAGVTVTLSGARSAITTTDANGNFVFTGLAPGTHSVTPTTFGFTFTPARRIQFAVKFSF